MVSLRRFAFTESNFLAMLDLVEGLAESRHEYYCEGGCSVEDAQQVLTKMETVGPTSLCDDCGRDWMMEYDNCPVCESPNIHVINKH